ncbi:hypothetical protein NGF19_09370 [Streptomyces sp. RY43-2]|uniref:Cysteinyl-tRNA synthetase n=1 Tax=Streptomyces macrolidinus TaxID=2952607 RepID=A0ABT0ZBV5_9ACTN|nr:hypothetical protein [Streptomyces macrolidinus]MCN9241001.1 hypothetical protein [Streptomyces macrolidinus]
MLRITDARSGEPVDIRPGLTRVHAHAVGADTSALRVLLVADVLARALELGSTPVMTVAEVPAELRARADDLGIRRAEPDAPGVGRALHVIGEQGAAPEGVCVEVAPATGPADTTAASSVVRLALLTRPRCEPVDLGPAALTDARDTLGRWRKAVAVWATRPSRPVPDPVRNELRAAWENDLDVPAVLEALRRVERADDMPDGARFETYAYADRLLGLDLAREIGAPA